MLRVFVIMACLACPLFAQDERPKSLDDRLKIELFAEHPQLVTPTGIDVDHLGRVVVVESNTHFPPDGYQGHPTDRILILENTDANSQADKVTVFADGLVHTMSVAVEPVWLDVRGNEGERVGEKSGTNPTLAHSHPHTLSLSSSPRAMRFSSCATPMTT